MKTIFEKKIANPEFKTIYNGIAVKMDIGEVIAKLRQEQNMTQNKLVKKVKTSKK